MISDSTVQLTFKESQDLLSFDVISEELLGARGLTSIFTCHHLQQASFVMCWGRAAKSVL